MRVKTLLILVIAGTFGTVAMAQNKISGTLQCKPAPPSPVVIGDKPNHSFAIVTAQCTWPKPIEMAGLQSADATDIIATEMSGNTASDHGYYAGAMSNGDKIATKFGGTTKFKDGKPASSQGTWSFTDGQGKLKGLKGKGTYKGTANADGSMTYEVEGEYSLP